MSDQAHGRRGRDTELGLRQGVDDSAGIVQLGGEGVVAEPFREARTPPRRPLRSR